MNAQRVETHRPSPTSRICKSCGKGWGDDLARCPDDGSELLSAVLPDHRVGSTIDGQFTILGVLGSGGMGVVYRALQHSMEREVALKLLRSDAAADTQAVRRFLQEARAVSRMRHPNVITVFDFGQTLAGELYLVMELLEGHTLAEELRLQGPLPPERARHVAMQMCDAIHHAHEQGLVHRDLKPDNVFVVSSPSRRQDFVKVLDFGVAKIHHIEGAERITASGVLFGTPGYIAPEQIMGAPVDRRADIYSLGVVLFEMLTGRLPFDDPAPMKQLLAHLSHEPPRVTDFCQPGAVSSEIEGLVDRCLAKDPETRPQTALHLADALAERSGQGGEHPRSASPPRSTGEPSAPVSGAGGAVTRSEHPAELPQEVHVGTAPTLGDESAVARSSAPGDLRAPQRPAPPTASELSALATSPPRSGGRRWLVAAAIVAFAAGALWFAREPTSAPPLEAPSLAQSGAALGSIRLAERAAAPRRAPTAESMGARPRGLEPDAAPSPESAPAAAGVSPIRAAGADLVSTAPRADGLYAETHAPKIRVGSRPSHASVFLDGRRVGRTPTTLPMPPAGESHDLELRAPGYRSLAVRLEHGATDLNLVLRRALRAEPSGAESARRLRGAGIIE